MLRWRPRKAVPSRNYMREERLNHDLTRWGQLNHNRKLKTKGRLIAAIPIVSLYKLPFNTTGPKLTELFCDTTSGICPMLTKDLTLLFSINSQFNLIVPVGPVLNNTFYHQISLSKYFFVIKHSLILTIKYLCFNNVLPVQAACLSHCNHLI